LVVAAAAFLHKRLKNLAEVLRKNKKDTARLDEKGWWWCIFASLQTILPLIVLSKAMDDFLHTPVDGVDQNTRPLRAGIELWFAAVAVAGLVLSGFLLQGLHSFTGL
jgi:hypothetical protein